MFTTPRAGASPRSATSRMCRIEVLLVAPELLDGVVHEAAVDRATHLDALRREAVGHVPVDVALQALQVELPVRMDLRAHAVVLAAVAHRQIAGDDVDDLVAVDVAVEGGV